jgi:hypothetical protein
MLQIAVLPISKESGGMPLHIILLLRLFRMWRVIKFLEVSCQPHHVMKAWLLDMLLHALSWHCSSLHSSRKCDLCPFGWSLWS